MTTIVDQLRATFRSAIASHYSIDADPLLVPTQNPAFGDYQCNAAMSLAKQTKQKPRDVAETIKNAVLASGNTLVDRIEIAGPGFINVFLAKSWLEQQLGQVAGDPRVGVSNVSPAMRIVVDYPSINMAKEMHIGHLRPSTIGDALSRILEFAGHQVIRQNHIGDWGTAFGMLLCQLESEAAEMKVADLDSLYKAAKKKFDDDPAFADASRQAVVRLQSGQPRELQLWKQVLDISRKHAREMFDWLGLKIRDEDERGESFYNPLLRSTVDELKEKGVAVISDGATCVFIDGPDKTPVLIEKTNGGFLYATTDLAAIRYRSQDLHAHRVCYLVDARQSQHFSQVFRIAKAAGWAETISLEHAAFGTILGKDGKPFKTKSGESVRLREILEEAVTRAERVIDEKDAGLDPAQRTAVSRAVGIGAVKYGDLNKDRTSDYVFDWDLMLAMEGNTAPYLQYAHARIRSIFRRAGEGASDSAKFLLNEPQELTLAKHILRLGEVIDAVARELKPHLLCAYLYELATKFSGFYEHCPVLKSEEPIRGSRLALCDLTARTMALGLDLLGIEHPEQM